MKRDMLEEGWEYSDKWEKRFSYAEANVSNVRRRRWRKEIVQVDKKAPMVLSIEEEVRVII